MIQGGLRHRLVNMLDCMVALVVLGGLGYCLVVMLDRSATLASV